MRKDVSELTEQERIKYISDKLTDTLDNKRNFWKDLRNLGLLPTAASELHGFSLGELNRHFAGVPCSSTENALDVLNVIESAPDEGFSLNPITLNDVILAVSHFSSQARGDDDIPQSIIAKALPTIGPFLVKIFNTSLVSGIFLEDWRPAWLIPLKKKSAPSSPSDFRPIALLSFLSKTLEKFVHDQIVDFITRVGILDPLQAGFRKHHSTATALMKFTEDIRTGFDRKLITTALLFDFSKAFDTISPTILLRKLSSMGFSRSVLRWNHSYLWDRKQQAFSKSASSEWVTTNLGVPRGSVLGPLQFINDVQNLFNGEGVGHVLYADDLQVYLQVPRNLIKEGIAKLSMIAGEVSNWAVESGLRLNPSKTQAVYLAPRYLASLIEKMGLYGIELGPGITVPFSETVCSLGVMLDRTLSWKPQVVLVTKKVNKVLYTLRCIRPYTTLLLRQRLIQALIFPQLDYCDIIMMNATAKITKYLY